ncbi:MAG: sulfatase [Opitutaceae bacterium]
MSISPSRLRLLTAPLLANLLLSTLTGAEPLARQPNILFIAIDDLRPELGCYGDPQVKSPNIDKLAAQGLLFNRAYCQVPVCGASRASLMTSILPTTDRFRVARTLVDEDAPGATTLPQVFKERGYTTISYGKIFHFGTDTLARSWTKQAGSGQSHATNFDPSAKGTTTKSGRPRMYESPDVPDNAYGDGKVAEMAIAELRDLKAAGKPFFLACGFIRPHMPFYAPKKYWDLYDREKLALADNRYRPENAPAALHGSNEFKSYDFGAYQEGTDAFHRMMRHGYYASTSYADKLVGDVLAELDRLGLADNTIVVIWGDHGWNLGEHDFWGKHNTLDTSIRVPLIIKVPGKTAGRKANALVGVYDIFPTLCTLANLPIPAAVQGRSFATLFDHPEQSFRDVVYSRYGKGDAVVSDHLVYTSYGDEGNMLFDLTTDPKENHNIAAMPKYQNDLAKMKAALAANQQLAAAAQVPRPLPRSGITAKED